jgi:hypothetical protein
VKKIDKTKKTVDFGEDLKERHGIALCHRCEHRVRFIEGGPRPRMECGDKDLAVCGCYMYRPVQPVVLTPREGDNRPIQGGWMISARMAAAGLLDANDMVIVTEEIKYKGKKSYISVWELTKKSRRHKKTEEGPWHPAPDGLVKEDKFKAPEFPKDITVTFEKPVKKKRNKRGIWEDVKDRQGVDARLPLMCESGPPKKRKKK